MIPPHIRHVLVVEDNTMNVDLLRENLEEAGYAFSLAANGAQGVALANELLPDIVLMDVNLPLLDGLTATRLLKKHTLTQSIPIIALTARAMAGDREACLAAGCDDYVSKPVDMSLLLSRMEHHLDKRPQAFVEMIRRRRGETTLSEGGRPGMAARDYEDELLSLNSTVQRLESELASARGRIQKFIAAMSEREQQLTALLQQQDVAQARAEEQAARLLRREAELRALTAERDRLIADLGMAQTQIDTLEQQLSEGLPSAESNEREQTLLAENASLRNALLQLHRSLTQAGEAAGRLLTPRP